MKIAIATDTNSGITKEIGKKIGVYTLPMPVIIDDKTYFECVDITNSDSKIKNKFDAYLEEKGVEIIKYGHFTDNGFVREATLPQADLIILNFIFVFM